MESFEETHRCRDTTTEKRAGLIELCKTYNNDHKESAIDINKDYSDEELIFLLWEREIDVGDLGFGHPYDDALKGWVLQSDDDTGERIFNLDTCWVYRAFNRIDKVIDFLSNSLDLPLPANALTAAENKFGKFKEYRDKREADSNYNDTTGVVFNDINTFHYFWTKMGKRPISSYTDLRLILASKTLTPIQLCYLLFESENWLLINRENGMAFLDIVDN
jgi:hypothetical protein